MEFHNIERISTLRPALLKLGVNIEIAEASTITGRLEFRVSFPTETGRRLVHIMRSSFEGRTVMKTHLVFLRSGMYKNYWEIGDQLSDIRTHDAEEALKNALFYVMDNAPKAITEEVRILLRLTE
jgi:hypothetical protein